VVIFRYHPVGLRIGLAYPIIAKETAQIKGLLCSKNNRKNHARDWTGKIHKQRLNNSGFKVKEQPLYSSATKMIDTGELAPK